MRETNSERPVLAVAGDESTAVFSERSVSTPQLARGLVWSDLLAEMANEEELRRAA
jgi:uncharacterized protein DUF6222